MKHVEQEIQKVSHQPEESKGSHWIELRSSDMIYGVIDHKTSTHWIIYRLFLMPDYILSSY